MAAGENGNQQLVDHLVLAHDDLRELMLDHLVRVLEIRHRGHIVLLEVRGRRVHIGGSGGGFRVGWFGGDTHGGLKDGELGW